MLSPVERQRAVALDVEVAGLARWRRIAPVIEDLELVARDWFAARPRADIIDSVGAVDVEHLRRADAVEDRQPVRVLPSPPNLSRWRFGRGGAGGDRCGVSGARPLEVEDRVVEGRRREEE